MRRARTLTSASRLRATTAACSLGTTNSPCILLQSHIAARWSAFGGARMKREFHCSSPTRAVIPFILTDVGEGIAECEVLKWFIKVGDPIDEFEPVCELQSDKATLEGIYLPNVDNLSD